MHGGMLSVHHTGGATGISSSSISTWSSSRIIFETKNIWTTMIIDSMVMESGLIMLIAFVSFS